MKVLCAISIFLLTIDAARVVQDPCSQVESYSSLLNGNVSLTTTAVGVGALKIDTVSYNNTVALCRAVGTIDYGREGNNTLNFEVWLPEDDKYNRRYLSVGNGGFGGNIEYSSMLTNVNSGYAVGGCDSGHPTSDNGQTQPGSYVAFLNNCEETDTWIHESIAMFTKVAKELTTAYFGQAPMKLYFSGCSTGGAQGFALAQFHPELFDGIYAGSPGNYYSHLILSFLWNGLNSNASGAYLDQSALEMITNAVLEKCDGIDGIKDGVVSDPTQCAFDITSLQCSDGQSPTIGNSTICLTAGQVGNVKKFYKGPSDSRTGEIVYPGFSIGSEIEWALQESYLYLAYAVPIIQNLVFKNLSYDYTSFDWGSDIDAVNLFAKPLIDETSPDLSAYNNRGGKLIVTQGWTDPFNSPFWPIRQRDEMRKIFGDTLSSFYSLFMIPGGGHCGASTYGYEHVPATYHVLEKLVAWVEKGEIPQELYTTNPPDGSGAIKILKPYP